MSENDTSVKGHIFNISPEVFEYGREHGLEPIGTGGGCDFMIRRFDQSTMEMVLGSKEYDTSPETLDEPANVHIYTNDAWDDGIVIDFQDVRKAVEFMAHGVRGIYDRQTDVDITDWDYSPSITWKSLAANRLLTKDEFEKNAYRGYVSYGLSVSDGYFHPESDAQYAVFLRAHAPLKSEFFMGNDFQPTEEQIAHYNHLLEESKEPEPENYCRSCDRLLSKGATYCPNCDN